MAPLRRFPWHPLMLPVGFVYGFYLSTASPIEWLFRPLVTGVLLAAILYAVCRLAFRDSHIAALVASGLLLVFAGLGWYPVLVGAAAIVFGFYSPLRRWRTERLPWLDRRVFNRAIDTVIGVLLLILVVQGLPQLASSARAAESAPALAPAGPSIQIIILDGYARGDTLAEWGFDNQPFLESLGARGFDVSERARSTYRSTPLVIASVLRMAHVPDFPVDPPADELGQARLLRQMSDDIPALSALSQAGYEIRIVDAGIEQTRIGPADLVEGRQYPTTLELALLEKTVAAGLIGVVNSRPASGAASVARRGGAAKPCRYRR